MIVIRIVAAILLLLSVFVLAVNRAVVWRAERSQIYDCDGEAQPKKKYDCILVLGAGVMSDGTPSNMLEDRLLGAIAMYEKGFSDFIFLSGDNSGEDYDEVSEKGFSDFIFLSGDNSGEDYDEVSAMERYCIKAGIPKEAIIRDDIGFSTSESIYNAVVTHGFKQIIVVTQRYHLYRAIYMAEKMGISADGFASDYRVYSAQAKRDIREYFARVKDFLKVNIGLQK